MKYKVGVEVFVFRFLEKEVLYQEDLVVILGLRFFYYLELLNYDKFKFGFEFLKEDQVKLGLL